MQTPRPPPLSRKAGEARGTGKANAKRQDQRPAEADRIEAGAGSPGTRLGRPLGTAAPSPWTDRQRKDHGRRRAQAARHSRTANRGRCPLNKTQAQAPSSPSSPCSPFRLRVGPGDSGRDLVETPPPSIGGGLSL